ncbi:hypothetical protein PJL18_03776 [Paenarthrobacter nicotinovorans]|nr:hypothetical protein [Paenarthrobacter nicotinovorans]
MTVYIRLGSCPCRKGTTMNQMTRATTMIRPDQPAAMVPLSWLPVAFHTADSTSRPPSSGIPGRTLKIPITRFASRRMSASMAGTPVRVSVDRIAHITPAMTKFEAGPARATVTERPGEAVKFSNCVCPPQRLRTIFSLGHPNARALSACASSWISTDTASSNAMASPTRYPQLPMPGNKSMTTGP